jgi:hypothetical protein
MTRITLQARRLLEMATPKLRTIYRWLLGALDALAEAKMQRAQYEMRRRYQADDSVGAVRYGGGTARGARWSARSLPKNERAPHASMEQSRVLHGHAHKEQDPVRRLAQMSPGRA